MSKGLKVVFVAYVHNIDTFNDMSKGSKEALIVLIVTHVERVESGICGLCTQYRYIQCNAERLVWYVWKGLSLSFPKRFQIENWLNIKKVMSKIVYVPCFNIT